MVTRVIAALRTRARAGLHYPCDEATRREGPGHQASNRGGQAGLGDHMGPPGELWPAQTLSEQPCGPIPGATRIDFKSFHMTGALLNV